MAVLQARMDYPRTDGPGERTRKRRCAALLEDLQEWRTDLNSD
jgi:hypothetical protein